MAKTLGLQKKYTDITNETRAIRIKNQNGDLERDAPVWKQRQQALYPNMLDLSPNDPNLSQVLITEREADNAMYEEQNKSVALSHLMQITTPDIAQYVLARLNPNQIASFNQQFQKIKIELKKSYPKGLSKDAFVTYLLTKVSNDYLDASPLEPVYQPPNVLYQPFKTDWTAFDGLNGLDKPPNILQMDWNGLMGLSGLDNGNNNDENLYKVYPQPQKFMDVHPVQKFSVPDTSAKSEDMTDMETELSIPLEALNLNARTARMRPIIDLPEIGMPTKVLKQTYLTPIKNRDANTIKEINKKFQNLKKAELIDAVNLLDIPEEEKREFLSQKPLAYNLRQFLQAHYNTNERIQGGRLKNRRIIHGRGKSKTVSNLVSANYSNSKIDFPTNPKLYLDWNLLNNNNVIDLRYKSNCNTHPNMKKIRVSQECADVLKDLIKGNYNERFMKLLNADEREIVKQFIKLLKLPIQTDKDESKAWDTELEVLKGEIMAGNDNPEIKTKLKQHIILGIKTGRIRKQDGMDLILQLA